MKKKMTPLLILLFSFVLSYLFFSIFPGTYEEWNSQIRNNFFKLRYGIKGKETISPHFTIINIDDNFIRENNVKPNDRTIWSEIIKTFHRAEVKTLIFDILFRDNKEEASDLEFAANTKKGNFVFFPVSLGNYSSNIPVSNLDEISSKFFWSPEIENAGTPVTTDLFHPPFYELAVNSTGLGTISLTPGRDGISYRLPLIISYQDKYIPSLVLAGVCHYLNVRPENIKISFGNYIKLIDASPYGEKIDFWIPIDKQGRMILNYAGPWTDSIEMYDMTEIFRFIKNNPGELEKSLFMRNTIVMIADVTSEENDFSRGIFESRYPKNGILSNAINTILTENYLTEPGIIENLIISCFFILLIWFCFHRLKFRWFLILIVPFLLIFIVVNGLLFISANRVPSLLLQIFGILLSYFTIVLYKYFILSKDTNIPAVKIEPPPAPIEIPPVAINEKACREFNITPKQRELLVILQAGYTYKKIAEKLKVQEGTIKKQMGRIKEKTGLYYKNEILKLFFPL